jgi:hypothetical protein
MLHASALSWQRYPKVKRTRGVAHDSYHGYAAVATVTWSTTELPRPARCAKQVHDRQPRRRRTSQPARQQQQRPQPADTNFRAGISGIYTKKYDERSGWDEELGEHEHSRDEASGSK